jgi:hypothetical protein
MAFVVICRHSESAISETRKLAAILVSDVIGYSRLWGVPVPAASLDWQRCQSRNARADHERAQRLR